MSVINQMLQELDARAGGAEEVNSLHQYVKVAPLPASRVGHSRRTSSIAMAGGLLALAVALAAWRLSVTPGGITSLIPAFGRPVVPIVHNAPMQPPASAPRVLAPASTALTSTVPTSAEAVVSTARPEAMPSSSPAPAAASTGSAPKTSTRIDAAVQVEPAAPLTQPSGPRNYPNAVPSPAKPLAAPYQDTVAVQSIQRKSVRRDAGESVAGAESARVQEATTAVSRNASNSRNTATAKPDVAMLAVPPASEQDSVASFRRLSERDRRHAILLAQRGRNDEALILLERALKTDPSSLLARQSLAEHLVNSNKPGDAMPLLRDGLAQHQSSGRLFLMLARLQTQQGDDVAAIQTLQRRVVDTADADEAEYHATLAGLLQKANRHREAIPHYLEALNKTPARGALWAGLGVSLEVEKRLPEARDAFARAVAAGDLSPALQEIARERLAKPR